MDKMARHETTTLMDEENEVAVDHYITQAKQLAVEMAQRQRRIEQLQAETEAVLQSVLADLKIA
jgi:hypothetical protein